MNKGVEKDETYEIIELENIGVAYININKENNNVHVIIKAIETKQPVNIEITLVYNWRKEYEYDGDVLGFYILNYYKNLILEGEEYQIKEADEAKRILKKINEK